jgi:pimeloyl-ACP methyl ester carboxylesterase
MYRLGSIYFVLGAVFTSLGACAQDIPDFKPAPKPWPAEWGSHRALVHVDEPGDAARAHLEWRRRDAEPEKKGVIVVALKDNKPVAHAAVLNASAESGDVIFTPSAGAGDYTVHYLPVKLSGGAFPKSQYLAPNPQEQDWAAKQAKTVEAKVTGWEAITAQDAFTEMEIIATGAETDARRTRFAREPFAVFVEDREHIVRMFDRLPYRWTQPRITVLKAQPGEHCVFQLAVWAHRGALQKITATFPALSAGGGAQIPGGKFTCYNTHGVDWNGHPLALQVNVPAGRFQPLWCGVSVPRDAKAGRYSGTVIVNDANGDAVRVPLTIDVAGDVLADGGVSNPQSLAKLEWLNSMAGISDQPTRGYEPVVLDGRVLRILGREVELGDDGLPKRITSFFNPAVTKVGATRTEVLAAPMRLVFSGPEARRPKPLGELAFTEKSPARIAWTAKSPDSKIVLAGALEFDGSLHYRVTVNGSADFGDVRLEVPRTAETTPYAIGLGQDAGPAKAFEWKWDVATKNQDSIWLGAVNAGLRVQLRAENYERPGVNIHYRRRPLNAPPSWFNDGYGGVKFVPAGGGQPALLTAFSGPLPATVPQFHFDFDLLITPFHPLRTKEQWSDRYFHTGSAPREVAGYLDKARAAGANVVNVHQGNWLNPYINYPFLTADKLRAFADAAHARGLRSKYYYTVRELSNWAPEIFAFRSMDGELLLHGKGGGHPWLEEHFGGDYWQAWYEPGARDVSLLTAPMSRLHNFYLEGLRWLVENAGCDGIYLDDIAYDRAIMLRARRVLDQYGPRPALIDLHSWNEFHSGGAYAQCANLFMDSFPFVDRLWFGEGHHYNGASADHFLIEISGIPFGLMGEMLEGGGNVWFGLAHGCTGRLGWQGNPVPIWKLWDDFGVAESEFIGWWAGSSSPVQTGDPTVKATLWKKAGRTLLVLANFDKQLHRVTPVVDWAALGLDAKKAHLYAPVVAGLQNREGLFAPGAAISVSPQQGVVLLLDEVPRTAAAAPVASDALLREATFADLPASKPGDGWTAQLSAAVPKDGPRADSGLVLIVPANVHAWYETKLPAGCTGVGASVWQDGKDEAQQWGPGFALIWADGTTLKVNRRQDRKICVASDGSESFPTVLAEQADVHFFIRWDEKRVRVFAGGPAMLNLEEPVASFPRAQFRGEPVALRLGKMPAGAGARDYSEAGPSGFNRFAWLRFYGQAATSKPAAAPAESKPSDARPANTKPEDPNAAPAKAGVKKSTWNGYERLDFAVDGRPALLVIPKAPAPGNPWIWRTEFFGHEPQGDIALLGKGYHVAYVQVSNLYGAPSSLDAMDKFYDHVRATYSLASKTVLEGFSRGGLYAFNWAARHPDRTAALYVDAPVCDFKSWPGGKGKGPGAPREWAECLKAYGFTEEQALADKLNPVDNLAPLAKAKIPILSVCGDADEVVPFEENSKLVETRYKALGGPIELIVKPGGKHHPHSLKDPAPIVDFILKHAAENARQ